jgi:hypothetical protein
MAISLAEAMSTLLFSPAGENESNALLREINKQRQVRNNTAHVLHLSGS